MKYVGIDLHKLIIVLCVMNQERKVLDRKTFRCQDTEQICGYFAKLGAFEAVVEATASYEWLVALIEPLAKRVVLAHPRKLRVIAESTRKTDKLDAQILAEFLALNMIPPAYRPTPRQREHRVLVRHRTQVTQQCSRIKCQIRRLLSNYNADRRDVFTAAGAEYLKELQLSSADRFVLAQYLADLDLRVLRQLAEEPHGPVLEVREGSVGRARGHETLPLLERPLRKVDRGDPARDPRVRELGDLLR